MAEEHNAIKYGSILSTAAAIAVGGGYGDVGVSRLSESFVPTLDLWSPPEFALLRGEKRWAVNPSNIATPAEFSQVGIRNPAGSNLIVVVDAIMMNSAAGATIYEGKIAASSVVDATSNPNFIDTRVTNLSSASRTVSLANSAAAALGFLLFSVASQSTTQLPMYHLGIVLSPGFDFYVGPSLVNVAINVSFFGRERVAFPGELQARG